LLPGRVIVMDRKTSEKSPTQSWLSDYRFLFLTGLVLLLLGFNVVEHLLLDADEADMRYERQVINGSKVSDPKPGHVYAFDHKQDKFVESKVCALQRLTSDSPKEEFKLIALNIWGDSVNSTVTSVGDWVGEKIANIVRVDRPNGEWVFVKHFRSSVRAELDPSCLDEVVRLVKNQYLTPFIVDTVYVDWSDPALPRRWVGFAQPILLDESTCPDCPEPFAIRDIVEADAFTRFKVDRNIVRIE
jgi:hypothetical protein